MSNTSPRTIVVTGASSGIGLAITRRLLGEGINIIGIGRRAADIKHDADNYIGCNFDLSKIDAMPMWLNEQSKKYATAFTQLSGIICSAGQGRFGSLEEFSPQQIRALMDINFTSQAYLIRELLPQIKRQAPQSASGGHIIFIGSESALQGGRRGAIYSASKFALRGFSQALRDECNRSKIGVSIINPGMVRTPFFDQLNFRPGPEPDQAILPEDVASTVSMIVNMRPGTVIDEINLSPLKNVIQFDQGTTDKQ